VSREVKVGTMGDFNVWMPALATRSCNRGIACDGRFAPWLHLVGSIRPGYLEPEL
jgi:hypothetical protein